MAMPGETIATGAPSTCPDCKTSMKLQVLMSGAGFYIGTQCECGPYSRESRYYPDRATAQARLDSGEFSRC
jgi:hypothetical protein